MRIVLGGLLSVVLASGAAGAWAQTGNPEGPVQDPAAQRAAAIAQLDYAPDPRSLAQVVRVLQRAPEATPDAKAAAGDLAKTADGLTAQGRGAEARRTLWRAVAVLLGRPWDPKAEFAASLAIKPALPILESAAPAPLVLFQTYAAPYTPQAADGLQVKLTLVDAASPGGAAAKVAKALGVFPVPSRDLNDGPLRLAADLGGAPDGDYVLVADLYDGAAALASVRANVTLVHDLDARRAAAAAALAKISGHADTKASILYPFDLAREVDAGSRDAGAYDYAAGLKQSARLLSALEQGRDLLYQAKGDLHRHYLLTETGEIMPYRLYVPASWRRGKALPLVLALHGGGLDENNMLDRGGKIMQTLADQYGYIVVGPLGYSEFGLYGVPPPTQAPNPGAQTPAMGLFQGDTPYKVRVLSEKDVLNVLNRVSTEYGVDRSRVYITGNSMGAGGVWMLGAKYPERFAAAAPCASSLDIRGLDLSRFKTVPVLTCVGQLDNQTRKDVAQYGAAHIKAAGGEATYIEVPGGTHGTAVEIAMPQIFAFFAEHQKQP